LAPEVLQHGTCTKAADVYSFGVLIFMVGCALAAAVWRCVGVVLGSVEVQNAEVQ
jgi:hypothetical protein